MTIEEVENTWKRAQRYGCEHFFLTCMEVAGLLIDEEADRKRPAPRVFSSLDEVSRLRCKADEQIEEIRELTWGRVDVLLPLTMTLMKLRAATAPSAVKEIDSPLGIRILPGEVV